MRETGTALRGEDDTVDFSDLLWSVLAKWRTILCCGLILALLLGGYKGVGGLKKLGNEELVRAAQENYETARYDYRVMSDSLKSRISDITGELERLREYEETSALYAIDPYNVHVRENSYYVDAGAGGESSAISVINAYKAVIEGVAMEELLSDAGAEASAAHAEARYDILQLYPHDELGVRDDTETRKPVGDGALKYGFIQIYTNKAGSTFSVMALGADAQQVDKIMAAVDDAINSAKKGVSDSVHAHTVACVGSSQYRMVSQTLVEFHDYLQNRTAALNERRQEATDAYNGLKAPANPNLTPAGTIKSAVKYAVVGFVVGVILSTGFLAVAFLFKDTVSDPEDLTWRHGCPVLGVYAEGGKANAIDRAAAGHRGIPMDRTREDTDALTAVNIRQAADGAARILVGGTLGKERIAELCGRLTPLVCPAALIPGGDICTDADSAEALGSCDAVVFAEEIGVTAHGKLAGETERAARAGKPVLGFILTGRTRL